MPTRRKKRAYARRLGLDLSRKEVAEAYMIFGGIPYYWSLLRPDLSLAQNVDELLLARKAALQASLPSRCCCRLVMITFAGLKHNKYWNDVQGEIVLDDLFAD